MWGLPNEKGMAFVAFGCRTVDIQMSQLEFVSRGR